ncbi:hypothetical protein [Burkholderia ubonensis]|uniref:hypothetical protein n=1 Tax=Burkholderia ubonensis TaxID=101571 RepID=UPI000F570D0D|nr:hypothetical protein [Burkholderia ubonensis]RQP34980.1 hypothetical protein DF155_14100 [Burkholderia ubonensis]RQP37298.1 hypothetical protein DF154_19440 [Burkholderia ubonensis]RQP40908.1 hypothetical protein DF156_15410 [Burkholderia ubonensis]RQP52724.1 hypothetical protein DF159_29330 [Burkholderia ubonensis]RQP54304.1 hypothetical protein DF144_15305 [Burkholderia ubonensis]
MNNRTGVLVLVIVLAALSLSWTVSGVDAMKERIMMRVSEDEPQFDATQWFANGMYQRIPVRDEDRIYHPEGMLYADTSMRRISPPPFTDEQVESLQINIVMALKGEIFPADFPPKVPPSVDDIGLDSGFDPRPQIVYLTSGFRDYGDDKPKVPVDYYTFYTLLEGKRFYVYIDRNGETGEILLASRSHISHIPENEEERRFQELQSKSDLQSRLDAPGWKKRSGELCPWPGTWECLELPVGKQTFAHNMPFPQINEQDVTWRFVPPAR